MRCVRQARREPQRGPEKHSRRTPLGRKFFIFLKMVHSGVLYIFLLDGRAPPHPLDGLGVRYVSYVSGVCSVLFYVHCVHYVCCVGRKPCLSRT